jgi:ribokinase
MPVNIAVIGSFVTDFIFKTPRRPVKGETVVGSGFDMAMGGKGANQAVMAAHLGAHVSMIGRVGKDNFGDMQIENMKRAGVSTDFIVRDPDLGTGAGGIVVDADGDNSIVFVPNANGKVCREDVDAATAAIESCDTLLVQLELPFKVNGYAIKKAHKLGKRVILDPAPACVLEDYFYEYSSIMTPNETEAAILTGVKVVDPETAEQAARMIAKKGCETVIITMGGNGVFVLDCGQGLYVPPVPVNAVDTTAAGDAFTGSLAVFLGQGKPMGEAVKLAGIAGALCATRMGAQPSLPTRTQFEAFLASNS